MAVLSPIPGQSRKADLGLKTEKADESVLVFFFFSDGLISVYYWLNKWQCEGYIQDKGRGE